ncbi:MAG: DUF1573 domain-containing protein [Nitrospirae bacterium]|nr:DUF1573 domain-containing protein [Nitrospirota bacterium]
MKKILLIFVVLFPALAWAEPVINFQTERHDFGNVMQGSLLEFTFEFSNIGTEDLILGKVNTS